MKKLILLFSISTIFICTNTKAQTEKGTFLLGGGAAFQTSDHNSSFTMNPNVGVFFMNNVAAGAQLILVLAENDYHAVAFGPFLRGYFLGSDRGKLFAQGGFNVGGSSNSDASIGFSIGAGYAFFMNKSTALEFSAFYNKLGDDDGIFSIGVGFQIHYKKR